MLYRSILTAAVVLTASGILAPQHVQAATITGGSSANALSAVINVNGNSSSLPNQLAASGKAPPKYTATMTKPNYSKTASLSGLTVTVAAQKISDTASSAGLDAKGGLTTISGASIGSVNATLSSPLGTALTVTGSNLVSNASFATTKAGVTTAKGGTTIGSLVINSPLFGINNVKFPTAAKPTVHTPTPGQVLYQSKDGSVKILLNQLTAPLKAGKASSVAVSAVVLQIKNFQYAPAGITVSGNINVATSNAN
jgi:hypothetical protein